MAGVYNRGKFIVADSTLDWVSDTIRALLVDATYTFDPDHNFVSDITGELTDASYARQTLANKAESEDDTADEATLDADPVDFGALDNETPEGIVLFKFVTNDADSPLISFSDAGFGAAANGAGYVVNGEGGSNNIWVVLGDCQTSPQIMAAFDTSLTPVSATPANTSSATLFTASADSSVLVDVANIGASQIMVRVGITPSVGSVHWKLFDVAVPVSDAVLALGPWFLESGDAVTVRTNTANDATFSLTGVETT